VIDTIKNTNPRYFWSITKDCHQKSSTHLRNRIKVNMVRTMIANGIKVKIVFVQNRNKKSEWLAILSTDCRLSEQEILRINGIHWNIKVFFKTTKFLLRLQIKFQGMSYDLLISHTTIVFSKYNIISWQNLCNTDQHTLEGLFYGTLR